MGVRSEVRGECEAGGTFYSNWSAIFEYAALLHRRRPNTTYVKKSFVEIHYSLNFHCAAVDDKCMIIIKLFCHGGPGVYVIGNPHKGTSPYISVS